jgi:hypothetical protein
MVAIFKLHLQLCKVKVAIMSRNSSIPAPEFSNPPLIGPPPGLNNDEFDVGELFRGNAGATNESSGKLQQLLSYLSSFSENQFTDARGYRYDVLSKITGGELLQGCLRPRFKIDKSKNVKLYFDPAYISIPGGDRRSLIPLVPKFNGVYLDKLNRKEDSMLIADGEWKAWLKIDGHDANIIVQSSSDTPPLPPASIGQGAVWNLARWSVEGSGSANVNIVDAEYFSCPFLPNDISTTHPFYPNLYQKRETLETDRSVVPTWAFTAYYGALHDIHTGTIMTCENADNSTELTGEEGDVWWVRLDTDENGAPQNLKLTKEEPSHQVHQPPEGIVSGQQGIYKFKAFELVAFNGQLFPKIFLGADITWYRWLHENVGTGGGRVYKIFNTSTYRHEFRTVKGCWGSVVSEDGDVIKIELSAENVGGGGEASLGAGGTVLREKDEEDARLDICEETAKFKSILQGSASDAKQIRITNDDDTVRIHGNGATGSLSFTTCDGVTAVALEWEDGLITTTGNSTHALGECNGT